MSHPLYNPYASGNPKSTQGQYGLPNTQTERDTQRPSSFLGHGSVFSSSGAPRVLPGNSGGMTSASLNYRSEPSQASREDGTKSSMDMHISKGREEARRSLKPIHQPMDHSTPFTSTQRDEYRSSGTGMAAYPVTSNSSSRYINKVAIESGNNNLNWLTNCARPSADGSSLKSSSTLSNLASGDGGRFDTSNKGQHDMQAIPGLGDYDSPASGKSHASTEPSQPKYTSESAVSILQRFGLEKEDLEHLISYPENQITPANLPFILREIRLQKDKKATTGVQSNPYVEHRPTAAVGGMDSYGLNRGTEVHIQETSTAVLQPSKVIDYGHTGKYTTGIGDEVGKKSDRDNGGGSKNVFMTDTAANRQNLEPLQKSITDLKSSALGSSHGQKSPFTCLSSSYSSALSCVASTSGDQAKQMVTQSNQTFQNIPSSFQLPKKDTATRGLMSEASKPVFLKQPEGDSQVLKTQASSTSSYGTHPSRPGLVLVGSNDFSTTEELSKTRSKMSVVIEHIMKHRGKQREQMQQQMQPTKPVPKQPLQQQQSKGQAKQSKKKSASKTGRGLPPNLGGSVPPTGVIPSRKKLLTSRKQPKDKADKDQPTPEMMYDYAAAPPRLFPHTCTLCNKECANMQDWITHQNSSRHLESCTRLRKHYPKWDGEIVFGPRPAGKEAKPSTSAKKTRHTRSHSRSKSLSPKRRRGLEDRKDKRWSRSRSPQSSKYSCRYDSPATPCYSSRSHSSERRLSPKRERQLSPRRACDRRSPFRGSTESWSPSRRVDNRRSPPRRRSNETWSPLRRDDGSLSPQRRGGQRWSPLRGFDERRSPPRRADDRHSPPRRVGARWSPSRRSDHSRSPQTRSQERRMSREGSSPPKKGLNSAESLAKKLLETSAAQSLSNQSDLATVVKTLAPALLAELAKMTSSSTSSSSSSTAKIKGSKKVSSKAKSHSRTEVELRNIETCVPYNDLASAMGQFGKTKSIKIYRSTQQAMVQFERIEAAEKLRRAESITIKGTRIMVSREKMAATERKTKPTQGKSAKSSASTSQTTRFTKTAATKKPLLPTPNFPPLTFQPCGIPPLMVLPCKASRSSTSKINAAKDPPKGSAKGVSLVSTAKVLVSKAKNVSTKKVRKTTKMRKLPPKGAAKTDSVTQNTTSGLKAMSSANQQGDPGSKQKPTPEKGDSTGGAETVTVLKPANAEITEIPRGPFIEEKILSSETETLPTVQEPEASAEAAEKAVPSKVSESEASENQASAGDSKDLLTPEKPDEGPGVGQSGTAEVDKDTSETVTEAAKGPLTETETTPTTQKPKEGKPAGPGAEPSETAAKDTSAPLKSANAGKESRGESFKLSQSDSKAPGSPEVQADTAESGKASPPTVVKLHGICSSLSHSDVLSAVENFGKTKSVVLFRSRLEAIVIFEKVEGAQKLKSVKSLNVNGIPVAVVGEKESVCRERKTPPVRHSASSGVSTAESTQDKVPPPSLTTPKRITTTEEKEVKNDSTQRTVKTETPAVEGHVKAVVKEQNMPTSDSKPTPTPEKLKTATEETVVQLRDKDEATEQVKGATIKTEEVSATAGETVAGENVGKTFANDTSKLTKATPPDNQPEKLKESKAVAQEENETVFEPKEEGKLIKVEDANEPMELEVPAVTVEEPEDKERDTSAQAVPGKPSQSPPPTSLNETQATETSDKAATQVQQSTASGPASTAQGPETGTETVEGQQQAVIPGGGAETSTTQQGPSARETAQTASPSTDDASKAGSKASAVLPEAPSSSTKPAAAAASEQKLATSKQSLAAVIRPTVGEMLKKCLNPQNIFCWSPPDILPERYPSGHKNLFITGLPLYHEGFYTEDDIANLLTPFGFQSRDKLFVIPQTRMAFATMPSEDTVMHLMRESVMRGVYFRGIRLLIEVIHTCIQMTPLQFYKFMKRLLMCSVPDEGKKTVLIWNISQVEIGKLREALTEFSPIRNFMPLLNKLFIEFKSVEDAERFESWYDQACPPPLHGVWLKRQLIILRSTRPGNSKKASQTAQSASPVTEAKALSSKQDPATTIQKPDSAEKKLPAAEAATVSESAAGQSAEEKVLSSEAGRVSAAQKPQAEGDKPVGSNEKTEETAGEDSSVPSRSTESGELDKAEDADEPMDHEEQGVEGRELTQAKAPKSDATASSGAVPESSSDKPGENQDPVKAGMENEGAEAKTAQKGIDSTPTEDASKAASCVSAVSAEAPASSSKPAAAAARKQKNPAASKPSSSAVSPLTIGEMLEKRLFAHTIYCHPLSYLSPLSNDRQLLISGLPKYHDGLYTEDDIADLLVPFGFQDKEDKLFVIPQSRMAFAMMPSVKNVLKLLRESEQNGIFFKERKLLVKVVCLRYPMKVLQFYTFLKKVLKCSAFREGERTALIRNISQTEMKELRAAVEEFAPIRNFVPLLNKLYIEFRSQKDADRFEGWYSHRNHAPGHEVVMLKKEGPLAADEESVQDAHLYFGETFEKVLTKKKIGAIISKTANTPKMLVTWLYDDCCCTEDDITKVLTPFGYQHKDHNIYIFPQACLAFVQMPTSRHVFDILRASKREPIKLNSAELSFHAVNDNLSLRPFWFYKFMMELGNYPVTEDRDSVIFIRNISPSEIQELRDVLEKVNTVRNFWPLLNKVFIEFQTPCDADWLGVWYSLLKEPPNHRIQRLKIPHNGNSLSPAPKPPEDSQLDCKDLIKGATLPFVKTGVPQGSASPFWISLRNNPYVFPSISPWFIIPEYLTVKRMNDIERASRRGSMCPTIMLTGLPEGEYKHEDVARLVWPFFPRQNLRSLYYNVTVLPLQRRAFVFFADWMTCCDFVKAHIAKRISLKRHAISVHLVLQNMYPEFSEEAMYKNLMKLSNARVPDPASLEERLLCVEVSEVSLDVITLVVEMVASITTFVNFLPLANRICIEMADSSSVARVVERYNDLTPSSFTEDPAWSKVQNFETLESLRQRLQDAGEDTINLEPDATSEGNEPPEIDKGMLKTITVTVGPHRLVRKSRSQSPERQGAADFIEDIIPADLFDELQFNEDDFVTVDEVYDDVRDQSPEHHRPSSSTHSSRERRERESSVGGRTSSRSSKDNRSSASSSSSRSARTSRSSNASSEKNLSKPTKSSAKPSSSASASKATSPSPFVSPETPSSPDQKAQQSKTNPPGQSLKTAIKKSETQPEQRGEEESAVPISDHTVSAEGPAAETVESETKMEARGEMHLPHQGQGFDLNQSQDVGIDLDRTNEDQKQDTEEEREEMDEIKGDDFQTPTSVDDQSAKQMADGGQEGSSESQPAGTKGGLILGSVKADTEESGDMDTDRPLQVLDSVSAVQENSNPEDSLAVKQLSEEANSSKTNQPDDKCTDKDGLGEEQETNDDNAEELDTGSEQSPKSKGKMLSTESCKAPKDTETLQGQTSNEDQPLQEDDLKDPDSEGPEQAFEILDSIDDQTETEDDPSKLETSGAQTSKDNQPMEDEEDSYQVIDSVEDQPTTTESEAESRQQRPRKGNAGAKKDNRSSRRSGPTNKAPKSDEKEKSPNKLDKTVKKYETRTKTEVSEEMVFKIVDSVEEEPAEEAARQSSGRRRSTRRKREDQIKVNPAEESEKPGEVTYEILDSVETANDEPIITTRSTRGRRGRPSKEASTEKMPKEDTPTRRRQTRSREKTPKTEEKLPPKESVGEVNEELTTYEILDSVEDGAEEDQPATRGKGKRGRPKKQLRTTKKDNTVTNKVDQDASEKVANEEEATYQILDSVEDDFVDDRLMGEQPESETKEEISKNTEEKDQSGAGSTKSEEEQEEPLFQVVDSLEDDQAQEEQTATEVSKRGRKDNTETGEEAVKEGPRSGFTTVSEVSEKLEESHCQVVGDSEEEIHDLTNAEGPSTGKMERKETPKIDNKEEDSSSSSIRSDSLAAAHERENKQKSPEKEQTQSTLVNLDKVSDEEEDYSDDTAEEEELRKRQTAAKEKHSLKVQRARRSGAREEREQRSQSSSRGGGDGGGSRRGKRGGSQRGKKRGRMEVDSQELVTLDEVGADEAEDEKRQKWGEEEAGGEGQGLVTLDEFVEEEQGQTGQKPRTLSQDEESGEDLNHETLVTLDEADCDDNDKLDVEQTRRTPTSAEPNHDNDTEDAVNFVIVDEVKDEENRELTTPKTRGGAKKRSRQTPVRKSTRGNTKSTTEEREEEKELTDELPQDASSSGDKHTSELSNVNQQEVQETAELEANLNPTAAGPELQPESKTLEDCVNRREEERGGWKRVEVKVGSKQRRELVGPESKRSRSQSPSVPDDFKLPDFKPNNPLGKEFMVPGYFCNLCSVFCPSESTAKELHCSSQTHYNNLKKHFQKLQQKSRSSARSCPGSLSD